jgi:hypothetical protein
MDNQQRHHFGGPAYDHMSYPSGPQFTNPWSGPTAPAASHMYATSGAPRNLTMPYSSAPPSAASMGAGGYPYSTSELLTSSQQLLDNQRPAYDHGYSAAPAHPASYAPQTSSFQPVGSYSQSMAQQQHDQSNRRISQTSEPPNAYSDALAGARGMVAMSQDMTTPRNIYGGRGDRSSNDSYGFPATASHSSHSSISSSSGAYPQYFASSVDSSVSEYSSASESLDGIGARQLPRPSGMMGLGIQGPPAPQSMMGSFNSKISSSTQKKHKCKVCDKRFTRPSSLQTHMYSHTGEKRTFCLALSS